MSDLAALRQRLAERRARARVLEIGPPGVTRRWQPLQQHRTLLRCLIYTAAAACSLTGVAFAMGHPVTSVSITPDSYRVGAATLHAQAPGQYVGDGALVIRPSTQGIVSSASDSNNAGRHESGVCLLSTAERQERCVFAIDGNSLSAVDTWTGNGWSRHYDDGQTVILPTATMAPVPFAVGR